MSSIFYYPWLGFQPSFMNKDVGLFPSNHALNDDVIMLVRGDKSSFTFRNITCKYTSNSYILGVFYFLYQVILEKYKNIYFIHIGLKNFLPIFLAKKIGKNAALICKADLNIETARFLTKDKYNLSERIKLYLYRFMFEQLDILLVETSAVYEIMRSKSVHLRINRLELMPNGLDDNEFLFLNIASKKKKIITIITRFEEKRKAPERLFDLIEHLEIPEEWELHVLGQVPSDLQQNLYRKYGKKIHNVKLVGNLSRSKLINHFSTSSVFICYSIEESYCISLVEAAAFNNKIITTDVGVARDLAKIYDDINIIEYYDPESFAMTVKENLIEGNNKTVNNKIIDHFLWSRLVATVFEKK